MAEIPNLGRLSDAPRTKLCGDGMEVLTVGEVPGSDRPENQGEQCSGEA